MIFLPKPLDSTLLEKDILKKDKKECRRFGPCGVGEKALYLNSFYIARRYYIPIRSVRRIYKRVAMSRGGFTGKGLFASIPYLVVEYGNGREKQCNFKIESQVDDLIGFFHSRCPDIPVYSRQGQKKLDEKARLQAEKEKRKAICGAKEEIRKLDDAAAFLEKKPELYRNLESAARKKRISDRSNPAYKWAALAIVIMGAVSLIFGIHSLLNHKGFALYFVLFGLGAVFLFSGASVLPTGKNNSKYIRQQLEEAERAMEAYLAGFPGFPVPAGYAHPTVLRWMQDILAEGKAASIPQALAALKEKLRGLNSSVTVTQEEYDDIMAIKPLFLVKEYR